MTIDFSSGLSQGMLLLLLLSCGWSLYHVKIRLYQQSKRRFGAVLGLNLICYSLLAALLGNLTIYRVNNNQLTLNSDTPAQAPNSAYVELLNQASPSRASLKGYGLYRAQWDEVGPVSLDFSAPAIKPGAVTVQWPQVLVLGQQLNMSGVWHHAQSKGVDSVKLIDPAGDTAAQSRVRHGERFTLSDVPKATGKVVYRFVAMDDNGSVLADEIVPLQVKLAPAARVLVVQAAPSFETNQMKQWASANGASLVVKTQISKARFLTQKVNFDGPVQQGIQPQVLAQFDLMICDGATLSRFDQEQLAALEQAIEEGLGLLVLADEALLQSKTQPAILSAFGLAKISAYEQQNTTAPVTLPSIELGFSALPAQFAESAGIVFEQAQNGRILGVLRAVGSGKVGVSVLTERYRMRQNGLHEQYSRYWQKTFGLLARARQDSRFAIQQVTPSHQVGFARQHCILSKSSALALLWQNKPINLSQSQYNPNQYCTLVWPEQAGWHTLELKDIKGKTLDTLYSYTFSSKQWQSATQYQKVADTNAYVAGQKANVAQTKRQPKQLQPLPQWLYWLLLSVFASVLWWERRL